MQLSITASLLWLWPRAGCALCCFVSESSLGPRSKPLHTNTSPVKLSVWLSSSFCSCCFPTEEAWPWGTIPYLALVIQLPLWLSCISRRAGLQRDIECVLRHQQSHSPWACGPYCGLVEMSCETAVGWYEAHVKKSKDKQFGWRVTSWLLP